MSATFLSNPLMMQAAQLAPARHRQILASATSNSADGGKLPDEVRSWLARLRLLEGVPFAYLVPDAELLPPESIRFFYLDRAWTDALVEGALSVGTINTLDRQQLENVYPSVRDDVDAAERDVRLIGGEALAPAPAQVISGFVLRSAVVAGWPGLHVRAYSADVWGDEAKIPETDPRRTRLLRLERLAPAVLLCLFDGVPELVHIEEPRQGVQFGVTAPPGDDGVRRAEIELRDATTAERLGTPAARVKVRVPFRRGSPGVIDVKVLADRIAAEPRTRVDELEAPGVQSAELAMQLLKFPYRQVFGRLGDGVVVSPADFFRPIVGIELVRRWMEEQP